MLCHASLFGWLVLVVNDRKFLAGSVFFSHTKSASSISSRTSNEQTQPNKRAVDTGGSEQEPNRSVWHGLPAVRGAGDVLHARHTQPEFEAPSCMDVAMPELLGPSMSLPSAWEVQTVPPNPSPRRAATVAPSRIVRFSILTRRSAAKLA